MKTKGILIVVSGFAGAGKNIFLNPQKNLKK